MLSIGSLISCWHFLSTMETPPTKRILVMCISLTSGYLALLVLQPQQELFCFTECMSTAEKDSHNLLDYHWLRASFPCSRVIHCMVTAWSLGRRFLYVVNNISEYSFDSSEGAYHGWKPILDTTNPSWQTSLSNQQFCFSACVHHLQF